MIHPALQITSNMSRILVLLRLVTALTDPELSGADIIRRTGFGSGTAYPALTRLEALKLVSSRWAEPNAKGSPRRRVYRITEAGLDVFKLKEEEITK